MAKLNKGVNDLATVNPVLAKEWHPTKNGDLIPQDVTASSNKEVWWLGQCGHEWPAKIYSRNAGRGCPYCHNKKLLLGFNDIASKNPELVKEWNQEKNMPFTPADYLAVSHKSVWWKCVLCGHEWPAEIRMRTQHNQGCPKCGKIKMGDTFRKHLLAKGRKSFAEEHPDIAREWHPIKNGTRIASEYTSASNKRVWWKCSSCGYEWPTSISNRVSQKSGCPLCAGSIIVSGINDLQTKTPALLAEWHPTKNLPLKPTEVAPYSNKNVWWVCKYGHEYRCRIADRQRGVGCSECSKRFQTSFPEKIVEYYVQQAFSDTVGNYRPDFLHGSEIDIFIPSLLTGIEYDGQRYHRNVEKDQAKDDICCENSVKLIRIREPKCPIYERTDPTFILTDMRDYSFSCAIESVLMELGIKTEIDISQDKPRIIEKFRNTAISGSITEQYPELSEEWHPTLNGQLKPDNIPSTKSHDRYYWKCKNCGYVWEAVLFERISGSGCPACAGKIVIPGYNDLATTHPDLASEWHPTKNGNLKPTDVSKGNGKSVWWKCSKCGYEWHTRTKNRVAGSGCNQCRLREKAKKQYKTVYQFTKDGKFIREYPSARIAAEKLGISRVSIQHVCKSVGGLKTAGGFLWRYSRD